MNYLIPKWSSLAKIERIKIVQSMYLWLFIVPILAKTLAKLEDTANLNIFGYVFNIHLELPFSWKIFYFSALCFAIANLVFVLRCYSLIKDHSSFADFLNQGKSDRHLSSYAEEAGLKLIDFEYNRQYPEEFLLEGKHLKDPFWGLYERLDTARPSWKLLCSLFYLFGFILISIVFYQNFEVVLRMVF
jgi:hypothetical protein